MKVWCIGRHALAFAITLYCLAGWSPTRADSWAMPKIETYMSANGQFRLTVVPRKLGSQLQYFEAKVKDEVLPESLRPTGKLERLETSRWVTVWSGKLVNEVAPVNALISDDGSRVVTFDNWHSVGHGDDVVVIYNETGGLVRSFALNEIVPAFFIDGFSHSVSSIRWEEGEPKIKDGKLQLVVVGPDHGKADGFEIAIELKDGRVETISSELLAQLNPGFCSAHKFEVQSFNAQLAFERGDLVHPDEKDVDGWKPYLAHAIERLTPEEKQNQSELWFEETEFELLLPGEYMEKDFREGFREALLAPASELQRRWFASRDQEQMTREIEKAAKKIKPGQLTGVDMRFFVGSDRWPRIHAALSISGAVLTQVDTALPIPPKAIAMEALPSDRKVDPACRG